MMKTPCRMVILAGLALLLAASVVGTQNSVITRAIERLLALYSKPVERAAARAAEEAASRLVLNGSAGTTREVAPQFFDRQPGPPDSPNSPNIAYGR